MSRQYSLLVGLIAAGQFRSVTVRAPGVEQEQARLLASNLEMDVNRRRELGQPAVRVEIGRADKMTELMLVLNDWQFCPWADPLSRLVLSARLKVLWLSGTLQELQCLDKGPYDITDDELRKYFGWQIERMVGDGPEWWAVVRRSDGRHLNRAGHLCEPSPPPELRFETYTQAYEMACRYARGLGI